MKKIFLLCLALFITCYSYSQTVQSCFNVIHSANLPNTIEYPGSMTTADFNNDGKADLAVTHANIARTSIYFGTGSGTFSSTVNYTVGNFPGAITSADFNGDGNSDLVLCVASSANISVLLGSGTGTFAAAVNYSTGTVPSNVIAKDFNADGKIDLAVLTPQSQNVSILMGSGTGTFGAAVTYTAGNTPRSVTSADFNSDGAPDLAVANYNSNNLSILLGSTTGTFGPAVNYAAGVNPKGIICADFNQDLKMDLALISENTTSVSVLLGSGTGTFAAAINYSVGPDPTNILTADFNADGKADIVFTDVTSNFVSVLIGSGTGTFAAAVNYATASGPESMVNGDFNSDTKSDLLVLNAYSSNMSLLLGSGTGTFSPLSNFGLVGVGPRGVASADFNGDSKPDLAVANFISNNVSVLIGAGTGTFMAAVNYTAGAGPMGVTSKDFNNDGKFDLAVANGNSNNVSILFGSGTGTFALPVNYPAGTFPVAIESTDFNGDGKPDLAIVNRAGNNVSVLLGSTSGTFSPAVNFVVGSSPRDLTIADFNGDGKPDLAVSNGNSNNISVLIGTGTGSFSPAVNYSVGVTPDCITSGDLNGDGYIDLVTPKYLLLGSATGTFSPSTYVYVIGSSTSMKAGDLNSDGITDLALGQGSVNVLLGLGGGAFTNENFYGVGHFSGHVALVDFNNDSKLDLVTTNINSNDITVLINTGIPTLTLSSPNTVCKGSSVSITASGANSYTWSNSSNSTSINVSPTVTTNYTVTGLSLSGCSNTAIKTISVNAQPTITVNSGTVCSGLAFTMVPSGATTFTYSSGSAVVNPTANTSYSVTGTSSLGCVSATAAVSNVTVRPLPVISVNSGTICSGTSFTMVPAGASTYTYSGGTSIVNPISNSSYSVTGTSSVGCISASAAVSNVTVVALPVISVNSGTICNGQNFIMVPGGASTYTYSSGSSVVSPASNATYAVTGTSSSGCISASAAISSVTVHALPVISVNSGTICSGQGFTFVPGGASTYTFSGGSATVSPVANTSYSVMGTSTAGCISTLAAVASVTVFALPSISVNSGSICSGQNFTILPSGASTYTYSGGTATVSPSATTSYSVTGTSTAGCLSPLAISTVTVHALPVITVNSGTVCVGDKFILIPGGASTYSYSGGSATVIPLFTSIYTVTGTSSAGCTALSPALSTVLVMPLPNITVSSNKISVCYGETATLTASGAVSYSWSNGAFTNPAVVKPLTSTMYTVTGFDANGCFNLSVLALNVDPQPQIGASATSTLVCTGQSVSLSGYGASNYYWSGGINDNIPFLIFSSATYSVIGSTQNGCSDTAYINIQTLASPELTLASSKAIICAGESVTLSADGATSYTWNTSQNGATLVVFPGTTTAYTVTGKAGNGCTTLSAFTQSVDACVGVYNSRMSKLQPSIYPNPNNGVFFVSLGNDLTGGLEIYNAAGQKIVSAILYVDVSPIDMSAFSNGIYFIEIKQATEITRTKIIKN